MRSWALSLLCLMTLFCVAQTKSSDTPILQSLTIPVELTQSIKAERVRPGDPVQFRIAEPILVGNGLVLPGNTRLLGKVLSAGGAKSNSASYLSIVIERADWSGHSLSLQAYVVGWAGRKVTSYRSSSCSSQLPQLPPSRSRREATTLGAPQRPVFDDCRQALPGTEKYEPGSPNHKAVMRDVRIYRDRGDGSTWMFSKKNIHLPSGLLLMLQNQAAAPLSAERK